MVQSRFDWARNLDAYEAVLRGDRRDTASVPVMYDVHAEAYS